jgi:hypothetical protein
MIGGNDVIFETGLPRPQSLEIAVRNVARLWPNAILQDALTGEFLDAIDAIPFARINELLCYPDAAASQQWDALGADPGTENTMIHLLAYDAGRLTVAVDDAAKSDAAIFLSSLSKAFAGGTSPLKHTA